MWCAVEQLSAVLNRQLSQLSASAHKVKVVYNVRFVPPCSSDTKDVSELVKDARKQAKDVRIDYQYSRHVRP